MCGGFALALGQAPAARRRALLLQGVYHVGKTTTYALLGAATALAGTALVRGLAPVQNVLTVLVGLFLIGLGLSLLGLRLPPVPTRFSPATLLSRLRTLLARTLRRGGYRGALGLGLLNGLLPCGLVYAALAKATVAGSVAGGMVTMAVFGLATVPALLLVGLSPRFFRPGRRIRLNQAAGVLVVVFGLLTLSRGFLDMTHGAGHAQMPLEEHGQEQGR